MMSGSPDQNNAYRRPQWTAQPSRLLDSYGTVLVLLVVAFILIPFSDNRAWRVLLTVILSLAVLATYRASDVHPRTMLRVAMFVGIAGLVTAIASVSQDTLIDEWVMVPAGMLLLAGPWVILSRVLSHRVVTTQTILGAICGYLYFGLIFSFVFGLTDAVTAEPFFAQGPVTEPGRFTYFSFVTLTTLGYGDLSPATSFGGNVAVLEALTGSIYLVTLVGRLVGLYGNPGNAPSDTADEPLLER